MRIKPEKENSEKIDMASDLAFLEAPLLPRTLRTSSSSTSSSTTSRLDEGQQDAYHSTYFLTAMAMHKSRELAEQINAALTISRGEKRGNDVEEERRFQQQVRRQGLVRGRKMPRFSMDPTTRSQKPENLQSILKDKHIAADPEEYFATIKRNELAERELKKLKGELDENPINDDVQRTRRQRRPGLPQRRTSLKHFSSISPETNNPGILKPTIHKEYTNPGNYNSLANISQVLETTTSQLHDFYVAEADKENMGNNPIDMLLSTYDKLDDRGGVALLEEYLQLKPVVLDKLHFPVTPPDTPDAQMASSRSTTSDVALTLLQKPVLQTGTLIDPYAWSDTLLTRKPSDSTKDGGLDDASPQHIDIPQPNLPVGGVDDTTTSLIRASFEGILKSPSSLHLSDSGTSILPLKTCSGPTSKRETTPDECAIDTGTCLTDKTIDDASDKTDCVISVYYPTICRSKEKSDVIPLEPYIHNQLDERSEGLDCETTNPAEGEECHRTMDQDQMAAVDVNPSDTFVHMEDKAIHEEPDQQQGMQFYFRSDDMPLEPSIHSQIGERSEDLDCRTTNPTEGEECHRAMDKVTTADVNPSNALGRMEDKIDMVMHEEPDQQGMQDQSSTAMDTTPVEAGCQESSSIAEEHDMQIASGEPKENARHQLKRRMSRGKSLAGGGTTWDCGLRRSTRMKFRPLEHWRGERLLYGRIHDSLATVIGVKCSSPGGSDLKVKSYVSDEYAELVELAALH